MLAVQTPGAWGARCTRCNESLSLLGSAASDTRALGLSARGSAALQQRRAVRGLGRRMVCNAFWGRMFSSSGDREGDERDKGPSSSTLRRDALLNYVDRLSPATHRISESTVPKPSVVAIRQTVGNLIGTLPAEYFEITISSREENLMQLMYSVLMTGYMFCNAHHRLELARRLETASPRRLRRASSSAGWRPSNETIDTNDEMNALENAYGDDYKNGVLPKGFLPDVRSKGGNGTNGTKGSIDRDDAEYTGEDVGVYAAGTQKVGVQGDVLRWHFEHGVQRLSAAEYIEQLELEVAALRQELFKQAEGMDKDSDEELDGSEGPRSLSGSTGSSTDDALARLAFYTRTQSHLPVRGNEIPKSYRVEEDPASVFDEELESELLGFLKTLSPEQVTELTECASADVMESMNALVERLVGSNDDGLWKASNKAQFSSSELGEILFWLMGVGHQLRDMEIRLSLSSSLQTIPASFGDDGIDEYPGTESLPRLPPGK